MLIIDPEECGVGIGIKAAEAGHHVRLFIPEEHGEPSEVGTRLAEIERIDDWKASMDWADLVLPTGNSKYVRDLDPYRDTHPIFAAPPEGIRLERDRAFGMQILADHGIATLPYEEARTFDEAIDIIMKADEPQVIKPMTDASDKSLSFVPLLDHWKSAALDMLLRWKEQDKHIESLMIQRKAEGIEMGVSGWMGKNGFLAAKWNENFEFKKMCSGNYGPNTGEMGSVLCYRTHSTLAEEVLAPLESYLMEIGYLGDIDVNTIVSEDGVWPLEFCCRCGWPAFAIQTFAHQGDPVKWMADAMNGRDTLKVTYDPCVGVLLAIPPFPNGGGRRSDVVGNPIFGIPDEAWDNVYLLGVKGGSAPVVDRAKLASAPALETATDYVLVASASGKTVDKARTAAYAIMDQIDVANRIVRDDIGECLEKQLPELHALGFAKGLEY